jgi:pimeloyl-ACP methyl ester carboxylesterase
MNHLYSNVSGNIRKVALSVGAVVAALAFAFTHASMSKAAERGPSSSASKAKTSDHHTTRNVLLVHGAWADGSSWSKVIPRLENDGLQVTAVQIPLTAVSDDVATVARAIALVDGPVVLVGHSYGGAVITEAGNDARVSALVYVAAFAPDQGESLGSLLASVPPSPLLSVTTTDASGFVKITPAGIADDFAQDVSAEEKVILTATQGPLASAAFGTPITTPAWRNKPSWFVVATEDRAIPPQLEHTMASRMGAHTTTLRSSHVPMLSHPEQVAEVIEQAAE